MDIVDELKREVLEFYGFRERHNLDIPADENEVEFCRREDVRWRAAEEIERLRAALKPLADQLLTTEPGHNRTRPFSWDDHDEIIRAARAALSS